MSATNTFIRLSGLATRGPLCLGRDDVKAAASPTHFEGGLNEWNCRSNFTQRIQTFKKGSTAQRWRLWFRLRPSTPELSSNDACGLRVR